MVKDHLFLIQLVISLLTDLSQGNPIAIHTDASAVTTLQTVYSLYHVREHKVGGIKHFTSEIDSDL